MPEPSELFGLNAAGAPNLSDEILTGEYEGGVAKEFILPNSYRNCRITLMAAHGVALGLKRPGGPIDVIETRRDWEALGYQVVQPAVKAKFEESDAIVVERSTESSRNILEELIRKSGGNERHLLTVYPAFPSKSAEFDQVSAEIIRLIREDGIEPEDIVVVTLDPLRGRKELAQIRQRLDEGRVEAITPGFVEAPSMFREKGCVTLATPFRAKGNEANIVFVVSAELVVNDITFRMKNAAFVALTRSRGWTYVSGVGNTTAMLNQEIENLLLEYPRVSFIFPKIVDLERRRRILRTDEAKLQQLGEVLAELADYPDLIVEALRSNPGLRDVVLAEVKK
jgi:superfamily I DNA and RNA helicase